MGCAGSRAKAVGSLDKAVAQCQEAPKRTFKNVKQLVKVASVYDGDTIKILTHLHVNEPVHEYSLRIYGIDTPEIRSNSKLEHETAIKIQQVVVDLLRNNVVWVEFTKEECYGRLMGTVYPTNTATNCTGVQYIKDKQSIGDWLIDRQLAKPYHGRRKEAWTEHELQQAKQYCVTYLKDHRPKLRIRSTSQHRRRT